MAGSGSCVGGVHGWSHGWAGLIGYESKNKPIALPDGSHGEMANTYRETHRMIKSSRTTCGRRLSPQSQFTLVGSFDGGKIDETTISAYTGYGQH